MSIKYARQDDIVWRNEGARNSPRVILMVSDMIHQLNEVGSRVWMLCDGEKTVEDIIDIIAREYEVDQKEITPDVKNFIADLTAKDWLVNGN